MADNSVTPAATALAAAAAEAAAFGIELPEVAPNPEADLLSIMTPGGKSARELLGLKPEAGHGSGHAPDKLTPEEFARRAAEVEAGGPAAPRRLKVTRASEMRIRKVRWLWDDSPEGHTGAPHGWLPLGSLVLAAGPAGVGKSQQAVWTAARVTTGTLPGCYFGTPRSVVYAATEDSWEFTILPRLVAAGADLDRVLRVDVEEVDHGGTAGPMLLPTDTHLLGRLAEQEGVALLVCDPLLSMLDGAVNDYRATEVRAALEPLTREADLRGFTVLGLAHFTKAGGSDPLLRVAGSGAFGQLARALIAFSEVETDDGGHEYVMSLEKANLGPKNIPAYRYRIEYVRVDAEDGEHADAQRVVFLGRTDRTVGQEMEDREAGLTGATVSECREWLEDYLTNAGGSAPRADVMGAFKKERLGSEATLKRAAQALKIRRERGTGVGGGGTWWLPEAIENDWGAQAGALLRAGS